MKIKLRYWIILTSLIALGAALVYNRISSGKSGNEGYAQGQSAKPVYYCPMHPTYTSDRPGDCPICNMKLVKREEGAGPTGTQAPSGEICLMHNCPMMHEGKPCPMLVVAKPGEKVACPVCGTHVTGEIMAAPVGYVPVLMSPGKQQLIGVQTSPVEVRHLTKTIRTVGTIAHDPELYQAQAEYIQSVQALNRAREAGEREVVRQAQDLVNSAEIRLRHLGLNDELIKAIARAKEPDHSLLYGHSADSTRTSSEPQSHSLPQAGSGQARSTGSGQVDSGVSVWLYAQVYEYELSLIRIGLRVEAEASALPGRIFSGVIRSVDPMVDAATRSTRVRIQLEDAQGLLKPDMYVNVTIAVDLEKVLAIPEEAVFDTGTKKIAFVDRGKGLFEPRDIVVGVKADDFYELKDGVKEGEKVVTSSNFLIDSESRLKAALQGASSGQEHQHGQ